MSPRLLRVLIAIGVLLGLWLLADWYFSDVRKIHRRLSSIQKSVAKTPAESDLSGFAKARAISQLFADPFTARAEPEGYTTSDRGSLVNAIHQYRSRTSTLVMEISNEQVFLDAEGAGANSYFTARFLADLGDLAGAEEYDVRLHWVKLDGEWLIDHAQVTGR